MGDFIISPPKILRIQVQDYDCSVIMQHPWFISASIPSGMSGLVILVEGLVSTSMLGSQRLDVFITVGCLHCQTLGSPSC